MRGKKFIAAAFIVLGVLASLYAIPTYAETEGDFTYTVKDGTAEITSYTGNADSLNIPSELGGYTVTSIGEKAFYKSSLGTVSPAQIVIPSSVTSIGRYAFAWCVSLTDITIPNGVTEIGEAAFANSGLTSVSLPESVTAIGNRAFARCESLTAISVSSENSAFLSTDGVLFDKSITSLLCYPAGKTDEAYEVPSTVTAIGSASFYGNSSLTAVTLPDGLVSIENEAFSFCTGLTSMKIPDSVTSIGTRALAHCDKITELTISRRASSIGSEAFLLCESLTSVKLPDCLNQISYSLFAGCYSLTTVVIPDGITLIDDLAFYYCRDLKSIMLPESISTIGEAAFESCGSLANAYLYENSYADTYFKTDFPGVTLTYVLPMLNFDGFQVRTDRYNGLRSVFSANIDLIGSMESVGLTVVEYGTLMASTDKLSANNDTLSIIKTDSSYGTVSYGKTIAVYNLDRDGKEAMSDALNFTCTITRYTSSNYNKEATIRGYTVLRGADGIEFTVYSDYSNENYRSISLDRLVTDMAEAGAIDTANNISYLDVIKFRKETE
ncbi:MAG: leucine-rich repeat domain-containing protein [Eubacteriales bacterium]